MQIVQVRNGIIVQIVDTNDPESLDSDDGWIVGSPLPDDNDVVTNSYLQIYDENWKPKSLKEVYDLGLLVDFPDDMKVDDDGEIVKKTNFDYYIDGAYTLGEMEYPDYDSKKIEKGTAEELLDIGIITKEQYEVIIKNALEDWRNSEKVSKFQAKAALYQSGMLETVQTHMETADPMAQMAWEDAQEFRRYSPTMKALAVELGLTEEQLDDLFKLAATIEA